MKANVIIHSGKIFRQKNSYKETKYYECLNSKKLACKALLVSNSLSDELNLIRDHNSKCSKHHSFSLSLDETKKTESIQDELKNNIPKNEDVILSVLDEPISEEVEQNKFIQNQRPLFQDYNISKVNENSTENSSNTDSTIENLFHEINSRINIFLGVKSVCESEKNECNFRNILELKEIEIEAQIKENFRLKKESEAHAKEARKTLVQELEARERHIREETKAFKKKIQEAKAREIQLQDETKAREMQLREAETRERNLKEDAKVREREFLRSQEEAEIYEKKLQEEAEAREIRLQEKVKLLKEEAETRCVQFREVDIRERKLKKETEAQIKENLRLKEESEAQKRHIQKLVEAHERKLQEAEARERQFREEVEIRERKLKEETKAQIKENLRLKEESEARERRFREAREIQLKEEIEERERKLIEKNCLLKNNKEENSNIMSIEMSVINGEPSNFDTEDYTFFVSNNFESKNDTRISENDSKNNLTNYIKDISSEKSKRRKRIYNFEETIQTSVSRKKTTPILKNIWGHGTINNCKKCSIFNDHVKKCRISNLFFGINRVADKKLLNMKCLECFRFKIHLGSKQCPDCQNWILIKNFDRHIDECQKSTLVKDICFKCNRECYLKLICNEGIWHKHRCYRQLKLFKTSRFSAKRKKNLRNMEKNGLRNKKSKKKKVTNKLKTKRTDVLKTLHNFINETRIKRQNIYKKLKLGLSLEYCLISESIDHFTYDFIKKFPNYLDEFPNACSDIKNNVQNFNRYLKEKSILHGDGGKNAQERSDLFLNSNPIIDENFSLIEFEDLNLSALTALYLRKRNDRINNVDYTKQPYGINI
jgi:hypothetical protein